MVGTISAVAGHRALAALAALAAAPAAPLAAAGALSARSKSPSLSEECTIHW